MTNHAQNNIQQTHTGTNTLAIVAFALSLVAGPLSIPFGHIALRQIHRSGETGEELAKAGLIIGYLHIAVVAVVLLVLLLLFVIQSASA